MVANVVNTLRARQDPTVGDHLKALALGAALLSVVGKDVLQQAVDALGPEIR